MPPAEAQLYHLYAASTQLHNATLEAVAVWCWQNMEPSNTVTIFMSGDVGGTAEGIAAVSISRAGEWSVANSAKIRPKWVDELVDLVM